MASPRGDALPNLCHIALSPRASKSRATTVGLAQCPSSIPMKSAPWICHSHVVECRYVRSHEAECSQEHAANTQTRFKC
jgi:hypothetical protein